MGRLHGLLRPAANPSLTLALDGAEWALEERAELLWAGGDPARPRVLGSEAALRISALELSTQE